MERICTKALTKAELSHPFFIEENAKNIPETIEKAKDMMTQDFSTNPKTSISTMIKMMVVLVLLSLLTKETQQLSL